MEQQLVVDTVLSMFPHFPRRTIEDDLAITGSVEATCDKILSGLLVPPPTPTPEPSSSSTSSKQHTSFLQQVQHDVIESKPLGEAPKKVWESTAEEREANLRARKEHMVRLARETRKKKAEEEELKKRGVAVGSGADGKDD
ncbi:hypothetical protein HDU76_013718 [Blyttiomyces sp. JEL0837]|nr:hypothetical protein HDU76_013718 [Blyttiomyces sp. JEL0837]